MHLTAYHNKRNICSVLPYMIIKKPSRVVGLSIFLLSVHELYASLLYILFVFNLYMCFSRLLDSPQFRRYIRNI